MKIRNNSLASWGIKKIFNKTFLLTQQKYIHIPTETTWSAQNHEINTSRPLAKRFNHIGYHHELRWWRYTRFAPPTEFGLPSLKHCDSLSYDPEIRKMPPELFVLVANKLRDDNNKSSNPIFLKDFILRANDLVSVFIPEEAARLFFIFADLGIHYDKIYVRLAGRITENLNKLDSISLSYVLRALKYNETNIVNEVLLKPCLLKLHKTLLNEPDFQHTPRELLMLGLSVIELSNKTCPSLSNSNMAIKNAHITNLVDSTKYKILPYIAKVLSWRNLSPVEAPYGAQIGLYIYESHKSTAVTLLYANLDVIQKWRPKYNKSTEMKSKISISGVVRCLELYSKLNLKDDRFLTEILRIILLSRSTISIPDTERSIRAISNLINSDIITAVSDYGIQVIKKMRLSRENRRTEIEDLYRVNGLNLESVCLVLLKRITQNPSNTECASSSAKLQKFFPPLEEYSNALIAVNSKSLDSMLARSYLNESLWSYREYIAECVNEEKKVSNLIMKDFLMWDKLNINCSDQGNIYPLIKDSRFSSIIIKEIEKNPKCFDYTETSLLLSFLLLSDISINVDQVIKDFLSILNRDNIIIDKDILSILIKGVKNITS